MMTKAFTIDFVKDYCASIGYTLLTNTYQNAHIKLPLTCNNKHFCEISFSNLHYGERRCIHCSKRDNKSIEYVIDFCDKIGWKCLEIMYKNCVVNMMFRCPKNHDTLKPFRSLEQSKGCVVCLRLQKPKIEEVKTYCLEVGFTCLSDEYKNAHTKLALMCHNGHTFHCSWDKIKGHRGCPYCSSSKSEKIIKYIIEELMEIKLNKIRPEFLRFPQTGRCLELDMYNDSIKLAFEYQGSQHFEIVPMFKMTKVDLIKYQERDAFKKDKCLQNNIKLICLPPLSYDKGIKLDPQQIKQLIVDVLTENDIVFRNKNLSTSEIVRAGNMRK